MASSTATFATKSWKTLFTQRFRCELPLLGAPMAGVSGGLLAAETCRAGALGFVAAGYVNNLEQLDKEVQIFRSTAPSHAPLCMGFLTFAVQQNEASWERYHKCLQTHRPDVVQFFASRDDNDESTHKSMSQVIEAAKEVNAQVVVQVCSIEETKKYLSGDVPAVDAIMAQGSAAGGHGYRKDLGNSTFPLAARILSLVKEENLENESRPAVLAAGGIVDGRGVAAALTLGCDGVVLGTRLWASQEALSHDSYKRRLVQADAPDAVVRSRVPDMIMNSYSSVPWPAPYDSIGTLRNESTKQWDDRLAELEGVLYNESSSKGSQLKEAYREAMSSGDPQIAHVHSGEGVGDIHSIDKAFDIVKRINEETIHAIETANGILT